MSYEQTIREKHAFRDRLQEFLSIASAMTNDELEVALGRLADMLNSTKDERDQIDIGVKGAVLKMYFDLRVAGETRQDETRRHNAFATKELTDQAAREAYERDMREWTVANTKYQERKRSLQFWLRLFLYPPGPLPMRTWARYTDRAYVLMRNSPVLSELFVNHLTTFQLAPADAPKPEVTPEDVRLLATEST